MSAPAKAAHLTPEIVARFVAYNREQVTWGIFHCALDEGNWYWFPVEEPDRKWPSGGWTPEERVLAAIFEKLTQSQRARLGRKASAVYYAERLRTMGY